MHAAQGSELGAHLASLKVGVSQQAWYCISDKGRGDAYTNTVQDRIFVWLSPAQDGIISLVGGSTAGASKLALLVLQSTVNAPTNLLDSSHKILASIVNSFRKLLPAWGWDIDMLYAPCPACNASGHMLLAPVSSMTEPQQIAAAWSHRQTDMR
ncbi:hypothetical protein X797_007366 [Metarhizium robertsii]|uniref:Uncharacterized protein n=1 Tax=Metarhizium robertsii TaxID=568076 RepID=A0A014QY67_9HYPO|nr:hypothetical protein X797_007366 [Metarhizium robertsii]